MTLACLFEHAEHLDEIQVLNARWEGVYWQEITFLYDVNGGLGLSINDLLEVGLHDLLFHYHNLTVESELLLEDLSSRELGRYPCLLFFLPSLHRVRGLLGLPRDPRYPRH